MVASDVVSIASERIALGDTRLVPNFRLGELGENGTAHCCRRARQTHAVLLLKKNVLKGRRLLLHSQCK